MRLIVQGIDVGFGGSLLPVADDLRLERNSCDPLSVVGTLADCATCRILIGQHRETTLLDRAATSASSGSTADGSESGGLTARGDADARTRAPPSNSQSCA